MERYLQWSSQGVSAIGTHSEAEAVALWRRHLERHVEPELQPIVQLSEADWAAALHLWTLAPDDMLLTEQHGVDAKPALLLTGLSDVYVRTGA